MNTEKIEHTINEKKKLKFINVSCNLFNELILYVLTMKIYK